ncbi:MAG: GLPGLI family protein [Bacteroidales bacterium]|jgi:GLPGLI family protein|nr:GLPGLI family protein [Bacteroidales bacterium]
MRLLLLQSALMLVTSIVGAQNFKEIDKVSSVFHYDYSYLEERGNRDTEKNHQMVLEVGNSFSKFQSINKAFADSLLRIYANEPPAVAFSKIYSQISGLKVPALLNYVVIKDYTSNNSTTFIGKTMGVTTLYKVEEPIGFNWAIEPSRDTTILDIHCLMARVKYAGRDYIAWFAPKIPINDGPYKFSGLPGLIIKLYDTENEHVFTLIGTTKPSPKAMYIITDKTINTNSRGFTRAFEASKSGYIDKMNGLTFSNEETKIRAISKILNRNNLIEQF